MRGTGEIEFEILDELVLTTKRIAKGQPPTWESMIAVADLAIGLTDIHDISHVVYEGFAKGNRGNNTTAYEHAELVGVIKHSLFCHKDLTFVQVPPTTLRSFYKLPQKDKKAIERVLKEKYGWASQQHYSKERSDCSDAVGHAILGSYLFHILGGWDPSGSLETSMERVLFGDDKKSSQMIGMLHRPHLYIPRDTCVVKESNDNGEKEVK